MYPNKDCPCPKCRAHFAGRAAEFTPSLRTPIAAPPDPYAADLKKRGHAALTPDLDPNYNAKTAAPADGYAIAVTLNEVLRERANPKPVTLLPAERQQLGGYTDAVAKMRSERR